ncbi:DUF4129 domain-containing protein [bacterium]|nr:DUF4129 domain-containing protein [bacterium]
MRWLSILVLFAIAAWPGGALAQDGSTTVEDANASDEIPAVAEETSPAAQEAAAAAVLLNTAPNLPRPEQTDSELERILAQAKYQGEDKAPPGESWWERLWQRFIDGLDRMGLGSNNIWSVIGAGTALLLLLFLLVRLLWQLATRPKRSASEPTAEALADLSAEDLAARAAQAFKRGEFRLAVRYRYLALLRDLDLPAATLMTNSQVLRLVGKRHPRTVPDLRQLVVCYEDAWYGGAACSGGDYELADRLAGTISTAVTREDADAASD